METSAAIAAILMAVIAVFQVALAIGMPFGRAAWGGQHPGVLPPGLRITSAVAGLVVYPLLIAVTLASAGVVLDRGAVPGSGAVATWLLAGFFGLGTVMNGASRSATERIWAPVSLVIAVCCAIVASNA